MCSNDECPMADECYRHEAKPSTFRQSFAKFEPQTPDKCAYFMDIWIEEKQND